MESYRLSPLGYRYAHTISPNIATEESKTRWAVVYYLNRMHSASKAKIISEVPGATSATLAYLSRKGLILNETRVSV